MSCLARDLLGERQANEHALSKVNYFLFYHHGYLVCRTVWWQQHRQWRNF